MSDDRNTEKLRALLEAGALKAAPRLIGCTLVRTLRLGPRRRVALAGEIIETEAYPGGPDRGSHTFDGRRTPRNESMYGPAGNAYVYFTYGMHHCMNVVTGAVGDGEAVLLRAINPTRGKDDMRTLRAAASGRSPDLIRDRDLASGPAKLCQALSIDRAEDGTDLLDPASPVRIVYGSRGRGVRVCRTPRIGLGDRTGEWADRPWRWVVSKR